MLCQICKKNPANVHLTEISHFPVEPHPPGDGDETPAEPQYEEHHICEACARRQKVPFSSMTPSKGLAFIHMIKENARRARAEKSIACPECGMTLSEFRNSGRLGCPKDYEVFREHLQPLLLRIHNATSHRGRLPGQDPEEIERQERLSLLREQLEVAIRTEEYEDAARLRDQIQGIESRAESAD